MNEFQKTIKYIAIAFAVFLSVSIIGGIASIAIGIISTVTNINDTKSTSFNTTFENVESIKIDCSVKNFKIEASDHFEIDAVNVPENLKAEMSGDTLRITSKKHNFIFSNLGNINLGNSSITLYIPENFKAEDFKIDGGTGTFDIKWISAENLDIDAGIGNIHGENITADKADIDCGVGNIDLTNVDFKNTDIDCGVGDINIDGSLRGKTQIDGGAGNINLNISGSPDMYNFTVDKGMGNITINGERYSKDSWNNSSADNNIDIDCGVGNIDIVIK